MRPVFMVTSQKPSFNPHNRSTGITTDKKARQVPSIVKVMLTCFFYSHGIVHHKYAPEGRTINKEYYLQVLRRLREAVRRKRLDMWAAKNFQLYHDNALAHFAHVIHAFLAKNLDRLLLSRLGTVWLLAVPQAKNIFEREAISIKRRHYEKNRRRSLGAYRRRSLRDVLRSGRIAGKSVCTTKGNTWKEIE